MCSIQKSNLQEPDTLQVNMETISRELNDLIVAGEKESGVTQKLPQQPIDHNMPLANENMMQVNPMQLPQYMQFYQNPQQMIVAAAAAAGLQSIQPNLNYMGATYQPTTLGANAAAINPMTSFVPYTYVYPPASYANGSQNASHYSIGAAYEAAYAVGSPPKYEFNNLRPQGENTKGASAQFYGESPPKYEFHYIRPLVENAKPGSNQFYSNTVKNDFGNRSTVGTYRKYHKPTNKHHHSHKILNEMIDYDKIVVDLSKLGWSPDGKEINPVLRIFALLRDFYNAIAEVPPSFEPLYEGVYEPTFAPLPSCNMPCTMNVQYQVKQACRKATIFLCDMQRILNNNKMYDRNLHADCERYFNNLRQLITQFESYKRIELEHKRGQFVNEDVKVHAERLEVLLEHINPKIRELRLRITALDWFIGIQHRGEVQSSLQSTIKDGSTIKKSKIGVINEILQMCNKSTTTKITLKDKTTTETEINTETENTKTATEIKSNEKLLLSLQPQIQKFNDNSTNSTTSGCLQKSSKVNLHTRQPIFYIG